MLAKCANHSCPSTFRYLHEGKLFRPELYPSGGSRDFQRKEWFWLCDQCASRLTLTVERGEVLAVPLPGSPESRHPVKENICLRAAF
jgi:hypothetical protein